MNFTFGDIVIVEGNLIGVVVKSWVRNNNSVYHEVYVRNYNNIKEYKENEMQRYMVRHKYLTEEELEYQYNATHPYVSVKDLAEFAKYFEKGGLFDGISSENND